eukprot:132226_1
MRISYSTTMTVVYFATYTLFLFVMGYIVYHKGKHSSIKSKSYLKDLWSQRKIYAPLIVYFYDTATDLGVIVNWYFLMQYEKKENYESVDMVVFFWCGITFILLYRVVLAVLTAYMAFCGYYSYEYDWYDFLLVLGDVFIFKAVYTSFSDAQDTILENIEKRQQKQEAKRKQQEKENKKKEQEILKQLELDLKELEKELEDIEFTQDLELIDWDAYIEEEIEPAKTQFVAQVMESITESLPQIILQSVFIIRAANDTSLKEAGSNTVLIMLSIIASLCSIANRFAYLDRPGVVKKATSLKPVKQFPACVQYWFFIRILWRICHIMSRFVVYVLVWVVLGGAWLFVWYGAVYVAWINIFYFIEHENFISSLFAPIIAAVGIYIDHSKKLQVCKYLETSFGLVAITTFGMIKFECFICADPETRQIKNKGGNDRILIFLAIGWIALFCEIFLYVIAKMNNIIVTKKKEAKTISKEMEQQQNEKQQNIHVTLSKAEIKVNTENQNNQT